MDKVINKLITAVLWLCIGGMIGYAVGAYKMFTMVVKWMVITGHRMDYRGATAYSVMD